MPACKDDISQHTVRHCAYSTGGLSAFGPPPTPSGFNDTLVLTGLQESNAATKRNSILTNSEVHVAN